MKKIFTLIQVVFFAVILLQTEPLFSQAPQKISYQAVVRNSSDALIANQVVGFKVSILRGSANGTPIYVETHTPTTNLNGLVNLEIGTGISNDTFQYFYWGPGPYFIKTEIDPTGGTDYTISGTNELLSVPFALFAESTTIPTYTIGLNLSLGGYVFYVTPNGQHGLVAAMQDQGYLEFQEVQSEINNPENHNNIGQNFVDWRLPTKRELNLMYLAKDQIGGFIDYETAEDYGDYLSSEWGPNSTDEINITSIGVWSHFFVFGNEEQDFRGFYYDTKFSVRAVRSF